ncbi:MAG: enoyl-CoA hydratase/isomerase family protein [Chromatocurvus sp.]
MSDAPVLITEQDSAQGALGVITLNVPKTLNSLTLEMVELIQAALNRWRRDDNIAAVFIAGSGDRALCAGGDVQALHASAVERPGGPCLYAESFFTHEYRMNYTLHTYPKPIICWGNGIVMGGGLGIMAGCSHRVVTETTRIAMPEITIALFPDVGGSWFLNHMPGNIGRFLALTGAQINAADALYIGLADRFITSDRCNSVMEQLLAQSWTDDAAHNHGLVHDVLRTAAKASTADRPEGQVAAHRKQIAALCDANTIHEIVDNITALDTDDKWLSRASDTLAKGSPLAALRIDRQLTATRHSSLKQVFQAEIRLATQIVRHPEFAEGVRALLIDKDRNPAWQYASTRDVPPEVLDGFFAAPWDTNPLVDL